MGRVTDGVVIVAVCVKSANHFRLFVFVDVVAPRVLRAWSNSAAFPLFGQLEKYLASVMSRRLVAEALATLEKSAGISKATQTAKAVNIKVRTLLRDSKERDAFCSPWPPFCCISCH